MKYKSILPELPEWCWKENSDRNGKVIQITSYYKTLNFLNSGGDANKEDEEGCTQIFYECRKGFTEVVNLLLDAKADIEFKYGEDDETPICWVGAWSDTPDTMRLMVDRGADFNHQMTYGHTPLFNMIKRSYWDCAEVLFNAGADPRLNTMQDETAFSAALKVKNPPEQLLRMIAVWQGQDLIIGHGGLPEAPVRGRLGGLNS